MTDLGKRKKWVPGFLWKMGLEKWHRWRFEKFNMFVVSREGLVFRDNLLECLFEKAGFLIYAWEDGRGFISLLCGCGR